MASGSKEKEPRQRKKPGRVPTSCAECRRLKLRCDRNVPCEKCVSRGCGSICPNGVLTPGKNNRMILANTEQLHDRIDIILARNRELENALQSLQDTVSDQPHPLLVEKDRPNLRINIQQGSSSEPSTSSSSKSPSASQISPAMQLPEVAEVKLEEDHNILEAFGTLAIGRRGEARYLGKTARSEYLAQATSRPSRTPRHSSRLSKHMLEASLPDTDIQDDSLLSELLDLLPSHSEALHLCEVYLEYGKFLYSPISGRELFDEMLSVVYRARQFNGFDQYHALSLLFVIFAIAELFNPNKQPYTSEAQEYYHLSRIALQFSPPAHDAGLHAIQSLIHMAQYLDLSEPGLDSPETAWMHIGHAMRLAQRIGLHLNSSRWKVGEETTKRRHDLFWRLFVADTCISDQLGRPPGISRTHIDVPPSVHPAHLSDITDPAVIYHSWNVHFTLLLHSIMDTALGPKQPIYSVLLDLDRKIRDFDVPVRWMISEDDEPMPLDVGMYRWLVISAKETALLNLHRGYFAQALQEAPTELQRHRYLPSVVAIYRSAWRLIHGLATTWSLIPKFLARVTTAWSHGLSAAIIMCLLVTRAPTSHLTTAALDELDNLTSLFDSSSTACRSAANLLASVQNLRRKAHEAIGLLPARFHLYSEDNTLSITVSELDRLNGKTSLLSENRSTTSASMSASSSNSLSSSDSSRSRATSVTISDIADGTHAYSTSPTYLVQTTDNLHATLTQDLREFSLCRVAKMGLFDQRNAGDGSSDVDMSMTMSPPPSTSTQGKDLSPSTNARMPPRLNTQPQPQPHSHPQAYHDPFSRAPVPPPPAVLPPLISSHRQHFFTALPHESPALYPELRRSTFPVSQSGSSPLSTGSGGFASTNTLPTGFQSGWGGGFGHSPFVLDSSWNTFVEQLGF